MNRRDFFALAGGAAAVSIFNASSVFAAEQTVPFYVRGLAMLSFSDPQYLRIALPKAPHHSATVSFLPAAGERVTTSIKGHGLLEGAAPGGEKPELRLPELVHIREIYRDAVARLEESPSIISIPWSAVRSITTNTVSDDRWTFVWKETGEEVHSFRPRRIAESLKIELVSSGTLRLNEGRVIIPLGGTQEVWTDFVPSEHSMGDFSEHFAYYMPYVQTAPGALTAVPKELGRQARRATVPAFGNAFARVWPWGSCFLIVAD